MEKAILVFQTDFTYAEGAVAAMYGVVKSVDRSLEIITATHEIPQYDTYSASYRLYQYMPFWPKGTIFVSVVDPGVGTARRACVAKTENGYYVVTPDNGTLSHVAKYFGIQEIREIDESINRLKNGNNEEVSIFHGRDLFGYCAARLASGIICYEEVGKVYDKKEIVSHELKEASVTEKGIEGYCEINDPNFGNLWTNVTKKQFEDYGFHHDEKVHCIIHKKGKVLYEKDLYYFSSFGKGEDHSDILYNNEVNKIAFAQVVDNFCKSNDLSFGSDYRVIFRRIDE